MPDRRSCAILEADFLDPAPRPPGNDTELVREVSQIIDTFRRTGYPDGRPGQWNRRGLTQACRKLTFICVSQQTENC